MKIEILIWRGRAIELRYMAECWGGVIAHLELQTVVPECDPLPITGTGYRSHFHPCGSLEAEGLTPSEAVRSWLDEGAQSKDWKALEQRQKQGDLFSIFE